MKRVLALFTIILVGLFLSTSSFAQPTSLGSIQGQVSDPDGSTLKDVRVFAYWWDGHDWQWSFKYAETDSDGRYEILELTAGQYRVEFKPIHHAFQFYPGKPDINQAQDVLVVSGESTPNIDATLEEGSSISGRTTDSAGNPLENVLVDALRWTGTKWEPSHLFAGTDADGYYTITGLRVGHYKLSFWPYTYGYLYSRQWYDNQPSEEQANTVEITATGQMRNGIDAVFSQVGSITGMVTNDQDDGLSGIQVFVLQVHVSGLDWLGSAVTGSDGSYEIHGLAPGLYEVVFLDPSGEYGMQVYNNQWSLNDAESVEVVAGEIAEDIDAVLLLAGSIQGQVLGPDGPLQDIEVQLLGPVGESYWHLLSELTDASGNYLIGGLSAGNYRVKFYDPNEEYAFQYYNNKPNPEAAQDIAVTTGETTAGINATLELAGRIQGRVIDQDGNPLPNMRVNLFLDKNVDLWSGFAWTDSNGDYDIGGLAPGIYQALFRDRTAEQYVRQYWENKPTLEEANDIPLLPGQTVIGIDARLFLVPGAIQVFIEPEQAHVAGAGWRIKGTEDWLADGDEMQDVPPGMYVIEFKDIEEWRKPRNLNVTVEPGKTVIVTGTYGDGILLPGVLLLLLEE